MSADDELNRLLGLLVRVSAELDMQLRDLAQQLTLPVGAASWTPSKDALRLMGADGQFVRSFSEVLEIARRNSSSPLLEDDEMYSRRLEKVLAAAEAAYVRRNRYVHDPVLPIHPFELVPGGPTHRRIRLDLPTPQADLDVVDLADLVVEIALLGRLCTATIAVLIQRRVGCQGAEPQPLDVEGPFRSAWEAFESKDPHRMLSAWADPRA